MNMSRDAKRWTYEDIKTLIREYENGTRWGRISDILGRSVPACVVRLRTVRQHYKLPSELWNNTSEALTVDKMEIKPRL